MKRLIAILLTFAMMFTFLPAVSAESGELQCSSESIAQSTPNSDYAITDALEILMFLAGIHHLGAVRASQLDVNADGIVDITDALLILMELAGLSILGDYAILLAMLDGFQNSEQWLSNVGGLRNGGWVVDAMPTLPGVDRDEAAAVATGAPMTQSPDAGQGVPPAADEVPKGGDTSGGGNPDFSDTNSQVEGVQESDIVKTDGKNIYVASTISHGNNRVSVISASNGKMETIATIKLPETGMVEEMLLYDGKLVVIWSNAEIIKESYQINRNDPNAVTDIPDVVRWWGWMPAIIEYSVIVDVYDTSGNFSAPCATYSQDGTFHSARMIDNFIYLISNDFPHVTAFADSAPVEDLIPSYKVNGYKRMIPANKIVLPKELDSVAYTIIGGLDVNTAALSVSITASLGSTQTIYSSLDNIYIARQDGANWWWWGMNQGQEAHTIIDKFAIDKGNVNFTASARLKGTVRNQFHFDEYEGNLRVVTEIWGYAPASGANTQILPIPVCSETGEIDAGWWTEMWRWGSNSLDYEKSFGLQGGALFILDQNMKVLSQIHRIGFGENVQSVRFMGDRGYVVTFWQTDPLFSFDLSDPKNPKLLGELKIPGFSTYLHSWQDGLLLGMGVDTDERGIRAGLKMTMFDVSDDTDLIEKHVAIIGGTNNPGDFNNFRWNSSPYEHDHRAALVCSEKNIIGFPYVGYHNNGVTAAYAVYSYSAQNGFRLLGELRHEFDWNIHPSSQSMNWVTFQRGLFIGDYVYAIADNLIISAHIGATVITEVQRLVI
jgi:uncharacterized secreted protein with C-terminal beta-propeller domain